jgi:hypothetical protein
MKEMYKGVVNSPETTITNDISSTDTLIYVLDDSRVPDDLPNLMTIGTGTNAETIKVVSKDGSAITVVRGFQGIAKPWPTGSVIARNFTEYDYNALIENIQTLRQDIDTNEDDILNLMSYVGDLESLDTDEKANIVLALNEIYQNLKSHKEKKATQNELGHIKLSDIPTPTKESIGLGNVDNVKQMPISNGVLENYREKLITLSGTAPTINLNNGNVFTHSLTDNTTYSIADAVSGQAHSFTLIITQGATARTITFPASVKWQGGEIPDMSTASKTYVLTFLTINGGTTWLGIFGGEF